jgi:hypothetical protein
MSQVPDFLLLPKLPVADWHVLSARARGELYSAVTRQPNVLLTTSGRASIGLALERLGIAAGDRVLVPTYHCPTMVSPVVARGGVPLFFPIDARGSPLLGWLEARPLARVRAIVVPHYFGLPRPMARMRKWCDDRGIALIEDCAHAFFGTVDGRGVGSWGDYAIASLTKFFPVPEGGCLVSATHRVDIDLAPAGSATQLRGWIDVVELAAMHGRLQPLPPLIRLLRALKRRVRAVRPTPVAAGEESIAMPPFDAALAHRRPSSVAGWMARHADPARLIINRRRNYSTLAGLLGQMRNARPLDAELPELAVPYVFPLWVDDPDRSYQAVRASGVPVFRWDVLWPGVPRIEGDVGLAWSHHVFQIGCHQDLTTDDIARMADVLARLIDGR